MHWLQSIFGSSTMPFFSFLSVFGEAGAAILVLGFFYWGFDKKFGKQLACIILMGSIWNPMIKNLFLRRRPYVVHETIELFKPIDADADIYDLKAQGYSFPSGHSTNAVVIYGTIAHHLRTKRSLLISIILILAVGLSRMVLGAHYPTDVITGYAVGFITIFIVNALRKRITNDYIYYGLLLLTALPGLFYCTSNDYYTSLGLYVGTSLGILFEQRYVNFKNESNVFYCVIRAVVGALILLLCTSILKLPFSSSFLESGTFLALLVRMLRYAISAFIIIGIYPMVFKYFEKEKAPVMMKKKK